MKQLNFEKKLVEWFEENKGRKLEWGVFDCAKSTLEMLKIIHGEEVENPYTWKDKKEALVLYKSLYSAIQCFLDAGFEIGKFPRTGDVLVIKQPKMELCSIVINNQYTALDEEKGLDLRNIKDIPYEYTLLRKNK